MEAQETTTTQETPLQAPAANVVPEAVKDALTLANQRIRSGLERHVDLCYRAYRRGSGAHFGRLSRTSTEYGDPILDDFFFAGYDGESWEEAVKRLIV